MDNNSELQRVKTRKRCVQKEKWKTNIEKRARYVSKTLPKKPTCNHTTKGKTLLCNELSMQDIRRFHQLFYAIPDKITQDNIILRYTSNKKPERVRGTQNIKKHSVIIRYFIPVKGQAPKEVCSNAFLSILGISRFRVQNLNKKHEGAARENRGGDRKSLKYKDRHDSVKSFINGLQFVESHYTRGSSQRQYLPCGSSIRGLWRQYCKDNATLIVSYTFFCRIFNYEYNISIKTPATDACSECIRLREEIKVKNGSTKALLMARLHVHKAKAKAFYDSLKEEEDPSILKLSFDCQKNMVLPKVPDQAAYYSRQLYCYNFTICVGNSKSPQTIDNVFTYCWLENERSKGSNEIASFLYHYLCNADLEGKKIIKLYCDGCPGQNKNMNVLGMLSYWLMNSHVGLEEINLTFPIVGHSFLPADRVFGRIEKIVKRNDTIIRPQEYEDIFSQFATVRKLSDAPIYDWKAALAPVLKPAGQLHFKFNPCKRFSIKKMQYNNIVIKGEVNYKSDLGTFKSIVKRGRKLHSVKLEILPNEVAVNPAKLADVKALLVKHFGTEWKNVAGLDFYRDLDEKMGDPQQQQVTEDEDGPQEEDDELRV